MKGTRAILVLSALSSFAAFADEPAPPPAKPAAEAPKASAPGASNMVVTKDPETGQLRPATAAEREKLLGRRPLARPERSVVTLPDGSQMVELGPEHASYAIAKKDANGKLTQGCVHGDPAKALAAPPAPKPSAPAAEPKSDR